MDQSACITGAQSGGDMHSRMGAAVVALTVVILAGCSGPSGPLSTAQTLPQSNARQSELPAITPLVHVDTRGPRIYVANCGSNVTTFKLNGTEVNPAIPRDNCVQDVAVGANGKIYVVDNGGSLTTYRPNGTPTTPTISLGGATPLAVAVGGNGNIYIAADNGTVTTYLPDGAPTTPTISGFQYPYGVAVDADGKIYVADNRAGTLTTYDSNGSPTTPTITGLGGPIGVAVDASGKIYVAQSAGKVTTYAADGSPTTPTITPPSPPWKVAVSSVGKIYVSDYGGGQLFTYRSNGRQINPTITTGLNEPTGIAVH